MVVGRRNIADPHPAPGTSGNETTLGGGYVQCFVVLEDVSVTGTPGWGIFFSGWTKLSDGTTDQTASLAGITGSIWNTLNRVEASNPKKYGAIFFGGGTTTTVVNESVFGVSTGKAGLNAFYSYVRESQVQWNNCTFEGYAGGAVPWIRVQGGYGFGMNNCWFEEDAGDVSAAARPYFVEMTGGTREAVISRTSFHRNGSTGAGQMRMVSAASVRGLHLSGIFGSSTTNVISGGAFIEQTWIDLGGDSNTDVVVSGMGAVDNSDAAYYPIQYSQVPRTASIMGQHAMKAPAMVDAVSGAATTQHFPGGMYYNDDIGGSSSGVSSIMYYGGGGDAGFKLVNNAPKVTKVQRNARTWVDGDIIRVSDASAGHEVQIRYGGSWYYLAKTAIGGGD